MSNDVNGPITQDDQAFDLREYVGLTGFEPATP